MMDLYECRSVLKFCGVSLIKEKLNKTVHICSCWLAALHLFWFGVWYNVYFSVYVNSQVCNFST